MALKKLESYLQEHHVKFKTIPHTPAFTSQEVAASAHISGYQFAKTIIVKCDKQFIMVVLAANEKVNFARLKKDWGAEKVELATESEFKERFQGCEVGAMPPFGNLYSMPVYVSPTLSHEHNIAFNAGSHSELVELSYDDFDRLVKPKSLWMH